jgi:photosystem II stability/assembly factor-like uncharacterized protein
MASPTIVYSSDKVALWLQRSCTKALEFLGCHDASDFTIPFGEISSSRKRTEKGQFKVVSTRRNTPDNPTITLSAFRETVMLLRELPCAPNLLIYYAKCGADEDPTNYDFIDYIEGLNITEISQSGVVNAIAADDATDVGVDIVVEFSAEIDDTFVIKPLIPTALTISALSGRIIDDIAVCDPLAQCGECDAETIGCQTLWIITRGSPGFYGDARIYKSTDGGSVWVEQTNSMTVDSDTLTAVDCDGDVVIITNGTTAEYQFTNDGGITWTLVTTPTQVLNDVFVLSSTRIWFAAAGGFVYFSDDKGASVTAQESGTATTEDLNSIHFSDSELGYAVGNNNAFIRTTNGGTNWSAVTGPAVGVNLNAVESVTDSNIVYIGDANGAVWRSTDKGATWTSVLSGFSTLAGGITDIAICECNVILIAGIDADGLGSVYQSIDGGNTWVKKTTPADGADSILAIDCCDVNTYFGVGDDGLIFKLAGASFRDSEPA